MANSHENVVARDLELLRAPIEDTHDLEAPAGSKLHEYVSAVAASSGVELTQLRSRRTRLLRKERVRVTVRGERDRLDAFFDEVREGLSDYERDLRRGAGDVANRSFLDRLLDLW